MVALPVAVGVWWYRSVKFGGDQVLLDTTQLYLFFIYKTPHMVFKRVIMVLAASMEFRRTYNSEIIERPSDNVEVPQLIKELSNLGEKNKEKPLSFSYSIKARALIHAHMSRMTLAQNTLEVDKLYIVKKCPYLIHEFVQCASQLTMLALGRRISRMPSLDTIENAMKLSACVVQALRDNKSPLLQLPHITEDLLRHFTTRKRNIRSLRSLACMKSDDRRAMLRSLNDDEYDDVMNVLAKMPIVDIEVRSEVLDDDDSSTITAGAIVTVTGTLHRQDMLTLFDQHIHDEAVEEDEPSITPNGDGSPKKKPKVWEKQSKKKKGKAGYSSKLKKKAVAAAAAAVSKTTSTTKSGGQAELNNGVLPQRKAAQKSKSKHKDKDDDNSAGESDFGSESESNFSGTDDNDASKNKVEKEGEDDAEWAKFQDKISKREKVLETKSKKSHIVHCPFFPDIKDEYWWIYLADQKHTLITAPYLMTNLVNKEEVELKFTAPPRPGIYKYSVIVRSDSYIDFDVIKTIKLDIKEAKEVDLTKLQWDMSEEEEEKDEEESAVEDSDLATDDETDDD